MDLVCPAGSLPALKKAVDAGADCVYVGLKNATNARNFNGLNFTREQLLDGVTYAHRHRRQVLLALNTYPQAHNWREWTDTIDLAAELEVDAVILADPGLMDYAVNRHPGLRLHLSVQGSATSFEAINLYQRYFGIRRAVLPRVLSLAQVQHVIDNTDVEIEVFGFGGLCVMVEGRCALSAFATGESPNCNGACSPGKHVRWEDTPQGMETRLNGVLIDRFGKDERAGYPTLCKGRFDVEGETYYALEEPTSLNTLDLLPELARMGVKAIKIEGRQRSPAYVAQVTRIWRAAIDRLQTRGDGFEVDPAWMAALNQVSEGQSHTLGAYYRPWK
ncbi:ubiquinone anaerobic biosynthesis protein UbiU [Nitrogeniibacter aestuarii]|uniref:ubiquinone anaerobic biosynthesis protein UbiU n=1 Tax=Nitrogeniibacter aestuarii TaxID=2815343 RepID=UPI001D0FB504|nr:peptidase U32 family protein [Nitrogeniibacter aestuarii]